MNITITNDEIFTIARAVINDIDSHNYKNSLSIINKIGFDYFIENKIVPLYSNIKHILEYLPEEYLKIIIEDIHDLHQYDTENEIVEMLINLLKHYPKSYKNHLIIFDHIIDILTEEFAEETFSKIEQYFTKAINEEYKQKWKDINKLRAL